MYIFIFWYFKLYSLDLYQGPALSEYHGQIHNFPVNTIILIKADLD